MIHSLLYTRGACDPVPRYEFENAKWRTVDWYDHPLVSSVLALVLIMSAGDWKDVRYKPPVARLDFFPVTVAEFGLGALAGAVVYGLSQDMLSMLLWMRSGSELFGMEIVRMS